MQQKVNKEKHEQVKKHKGINVPEKRSEAHAWLLGFKEVKEYWLDTMKAERTGSEQTCKVYLDRIIPFIQWMNMTPAEIVAKGAEEVRKDQKRGLQRKTWADRTAIEFFTWIQTQKSKTGIPYSRTRAKQCYGAIRSFLRYNGFQFKGRTPRAKPSVSEPLPSNKQMEQAWKLATPTQKLAVGLLRSTMWRPEDILTLKYGDLQDQHNPKRFYIEKVTEKQDLPVAVFLTAETTELLRLHMRKKYGDKKPDPNETVLTCRYDGLLKLVQRFGRNINFKMSPKIFRKMGRTRGSPIIGQDALFKMAGWTLPGVGRNYMLPSPQDTLDNYLQIEKLLTFEPKTVDNKEQIVENLFNMAIAQGMPLEEARKLRTIWRTKALKPEQMAVELRKKMRQIQPAGYLNAEQVAARQFAKILMMALEKVKEENKQGTPK